MYKIYTTIVQHSSYSDSKWCSRDMGGSVAVQTSVVMLSLVCVFALRYAPDWRLSEIKLTLAWWRRCCHVHVHVHVHAQSYTLYMYNEKTSYVASVYRVWWLFSKFTPSAHQLTSLDPSLRITSNYIHKLRNSLYIQQFTTVAFAVAAD